MLAAAMLALATSKIYFGHDDAYWLPLPIFYAAAILEAVASLLLLLGWTQTGAGIVLGICLLGGILGLALYSSDIPCGCVGFRVSSRQHLLLCALLGFVSFHLYLSPTFPKSGTDL